MEIPKINEEYQFYDDGKIRWSRRYTAKVIDVIPFDKIDDKIKECWQKEVKSHSGLYRETTDYFIKAKIEKYDENYIYFVRMKFTNGWFSFDIDNVWQSGELDVDGSLTKELEKYEPRQSN